jgi:hypothetical protein
MKVDIAKYIATCDVCQQVKVEHKTPIVLLKPSKILKWMWVHITMDFVVSLHCSPQSKDVKGPRGDE